MNKFVRAIKDLDIDSIEKMLPKCTGWSERDGKNALHYLCGVDVSGVKFLNTSLYFMF